MLDAASWTTSEPSPATECVSLPLEPAGAVSESVNAVSRLSSKPRPSPVTTAW